MGTSKDGTIFFPPTLRVRSPPLAPPVFFNASSKSSNVYTLQLPLAHPLLKMKNDLIQFFLFLWLSSLEARTYHIASFWNA